MSAEGYANAPLVGRDVALVCMDTILRIFYITK